MENNSKTNINLSVIIPFTERYDPVKELFQEYKQGLDTTGLSYEIIYVLDGEQPKAMEELNALRNTERFTIITLAKRFGESTALNAGFSECSGELILTLPAFQQVDSEAIPALVSAIKDNDMVMARRWPRKDSFFNRVQLKTFNFLLRSFTDLKIHDAGCSARIFKRSVLEEVHLYGDLYRFLPIMAHRQGFRIAEIDTPQSQRDTFRRIYSPGLYLRRLLDIFTIFFLVKFTKKPLRFFGLIGTSLFGAGLLAAVYLVIDRLVFDVALANRPALFLSSLLIVLGIQIIAIGLIGEIIIFTHAKDLKEYKIDKIIN
ncbi:glycosyltransferase [Gammaproteobacteria bacterium]|nr:glycosyltransferase [Gammaproteobacteria bacterium]